MFRILAIDHLVLRVRDPVPMLHFYSTVLGCTVERIRADLGLWHLRAGSSLIDLVSVDGRLGQAGGAAAGVEGRNLDHLCLRIDPFDLPALHAHLRSHGITPGSDGLRYGADGDGPSLYLSDPEGNGVELKGPPQPFDGSDRAG